MLISKTQTARKGPFMSASVEDTYYALQRIIEAQTKTRNNLDTQFENVTRDRNEKYIVLAGLLAPLLPDLKAETLRDAQAMVFTPTTGRNSSPSLEDYVAAARKDSDAARARRAEILDQTGTKSVAEIEALLPQAAKKTSEAAAALRTATQAKTSAKEVLSDVTYHNSFLTAIKINQQSLPTIQNYGWREWLGSRNKREAYATVKSVPNITAKFEQLAQATGTYDAAVAADAQANAEHSGLKASLRDFRRAGEKIREEGAILADARLYFAQLILRRPDNVEHVAQALPPEQATLFRMGALQAVSLGGLADSIETQFGQTQLAINNTRNSQGKLEKAMRSSQGRRARITSVDLPGLNQAAEQIERQIDDTNRRIRDRQSASSAYQSDNSAANFMMMMASYTLFAAAISDGNGAYASPHGNTGGMQNTAPDTGASLTGPDAGASLAFTGLDGAATLQGIDAGAGFTVPSLDISLPSIGNIDVSIPNNAFDGVANINTGGGFDGGGFSGGFDGGGAMAPVFAPQMK